MPKSTLTIVGIIIILIGLLVGIVVIQQTQIFKPKADINLSPAALFITNISASSATISWLTPSTPTTGAVRYGTSLSTMESVVPDTRDTLDAMGTYTTHYVVLEELEPATTYYLQIQSGGRTFTADNFTLTTLPVAAHPPAVSDPLFGKIVADGMPVRGVIVYLYLNEQTTPVGSVLSNDQGTWALDTSSLRPEGDIYYEPNPENLIQLIALTGEARGEYTGKLGPRTESISISLDTSLTAQDQAPTDLNTINTSLPSPRIQQSGSSTQNAGDYNADGVVNSLDVSAFLQLWEQRDVQADVNGDGAMNTLDYSMILDQIGEPRP